MIKIILILIMILINLGLLEKCFIINIECMVIVYLYILIIILMISLYIVFDSGINVGWRNDFSWKRYFKNLLKYGSFINNIFRYVN